MTTPYLILEEYVFYSNNVAETVRGRIVKEIVSESRMDHITQNGLTHNPISWDVNYHCGSTLPSNYHPSTLEEAREQLFVYVNAFCHNTPLKNNDY
ncbi:hypothetical protein ACY2L5_003016 [Providencia rettgeri]